MTATLKWTAAALTALATAGIAAWLVVFPEPRFPRPTGPYAIGTRIYHWTDAARPEPFTPDPRDRRELVAQVWYPARTSGGSRQPYMDSHEPMRVLAGPLHVPAFLLTRIERAPTHAVRDAPAAPGRFPVLLHPPGFVAFRGASLFWIEDLVSHGYVVIALDQPGTSAATVLADGRVVPSIGKPTLSRYMPPRWSPAADPAPVLNGVRLPGGIIPFLARDLSFALSRAEGLDEADAILAGHLDTPRAGTFGMSLGGYVAPEACRLDARFRACLAADAGKTTAVARDGLAQPVMIIGRPAASMRAERRRAGGWPEVEIAHTNGTQRALYDHNRADAYFLTMDGMFHLNWTDASVWTPLIGWIGLAGPIDPYEGFAETNAYSLAFFDRTLKGKPAPLLDQTPGPLPHARLEARRVS